MTGPTKKAASHSPAATARPASGHSHASGIRMTQVLATRRPGSPAPKLAAAQDVVQFGHRPDPDMDKVSCLRKWAFGQGGAQASSHPATPGDRPSGRLKPGHLENGSKWFSGPLALKASYESLKKGEIADGLLNLGSGTADTCGAALSAAGTAVSESRVGRLVGAVAGKVGTAASIAGPVKTAWDLRGAIKDHNMVATTEKTLELGAGCAALAPLFVTSEAGVGTALAFEAQAAALATGAAEVAITGTAAAAAQLVAFGGAVYMGTRGVSQVSGLDDKMTDNFEAMAVRSEGRAMLDNVETRTSASAATVPMMDNRELAFHVSHDSDTVARAITGTLTQIEQATVSGDNATLKTAQDQLARLRAAQRGELGVG